MPISFTGAFNPSTLTVPGVYINAQPPGPGVIRPAAFGLLGIVGVASWGPTNVATLVPSTAGLALTFGNPVVRANDLVTAATVALQVQQSAGIGANLMLTRVTDGTDTAATIVAGGTGALTVTSKYTGSLANTDTVTIATGSGNTTATPVWKIIIQRQGQIAEVFDNLTGTGNAFWLAAAAAINNGNSALRGPSKLVVASAGASTSAPTAGTVTLTGGTDGVSSITSSVLVGTDTVPRKGVYTFRNSGASDLFIADMSDTTQEATLIAFASSEGILVHTSGPSGETVSAAQTTELTVGSNSPWLKRYLGDWPYWADNFNGQLRSLAPATFGAAEMSTLQPQNSGLNKIIAGIVSTQRSRTGIPYGNDELATLKATGIEVIANPLPAGPGFGMELGITTTSNGTANTDNWPRLTSFLARSLVGPGALGTLIGQTITAQFFATGYAMLNNFLLPMAQPGPNQIIQGFNIQFNQQNNPQSQTALGVVVAQVMIQYLGIAQIFLVNMQNGATVVLPASTNPSAAAAALAAA